MTSSFVELGIDQALVDILQRSSITEPTPVQAEAIPQVLNGRDLIATAPTGTGKTGAFLLPALQRLNAEPKPGRGPRVLVLSPTRELAQQIGKAAKQFSEGLPRVKTVTITGGESYQQQNKVLSRGYEILIATPGRLIDQLGSDRIDLSRVEFFVLDEADRMLDIGFTDAVLEIAGKLPENRQTLCFTATLSPEVNQLASRLLKDPHRIDVGGESHSRDNITQRLIYVDHLGHKHDLLRHFLAGEEVTGQAIVFTATKRDADELANALSEAGHPAIALHGDLSQKERTRSLNKLRSGESRVLVATDVAARGIDVSGISHVFNFDLPKFAEDYVHRIGRTGRAGASGIAVSFVGRTDVHALKRIERFVGQPIEETKVEGLEARFRPEHGGRGAGRGQGPRGNAPRGRAGGHDSRGRGDRPQQNRGRRDDAPRDDRQPRFNQDRQDRQDRQPRAAQGDRQPRFNQDDRQPRFNQDRQDRQPRVAQGDRQPRFSQDDRQPRFNQDRKDRQPRAAADDRQPRFQDDRQPRFPSDRQPRFGQDDRQPAGGDEQPHYYDVHQPDFNEDRRPAAARPARAGGQGKARGADRRPGAAQGPRGGKPRSGGQGKAQGGFGKPAAQRGRRPKQVGLYLPETPAARPDWRNERLVDQPAKPKIIKVEKRERPARAAEGNTWTFTGRTLRLKKEGGEE